VLLIDYFLLISNPDFSSIVNIEDPASVAMKVRPLDGTESITKFAFLKNSGSGLLNVTILQPGY